MKGEERKTESIHIFRRIVLLIFIVLVTVLAVLHQLSVAGFGPVDALCPFGGIETIYKLLAGGGFINRTFTSNIVLLTGIVVLGILLARYFCGWICMFGGLQEYFALFGKKVFKKRFAIPEKIDKPMRYVKYFVLFFMLYFTWKIGDLVIRPYDPFVAYSHLAGGLKSVWDEFAIGLIILVLSLIGSMFYDRVFCKYLCPFGAFLGILGKISIYRIKRTESTCTHCKICDKVCPVNINISTKPAVKSAECINCLLCVTDCPTKKSTLYTVIARKTFRPVMVGVIGLLVYTGIIGASKITGYWESANMTLEQKLDEGTLNPDDIKGSNTLEEVSANFNIEINDLYTRLNITPVMVPQNTRLKDIQYLVPDKPFEAEEVRVIVREILGISNDTTQSFLKENSGPETAEPGIDHPAKTPLKKAVSGKDSTVDAIAPVEQNFTDFELEGTMTIQQVAKILNMSEAQIIKKLGLPGTIPIDRPLRDMREEYGYTMPQLKEKMKK